MQGQIVKIRSNIHDVECNQVIYQVIPRGIFRKDNILPRVGDYVIFNPDTKTIDKILPRKNEFDRPLVSNIDQAFLITSLKSPDFSIGLLDRFLVLMELHNVNSIICVTKRDLLDENEFCEIKKILDYYQSIGYLVVYNDEIEKIKSLLNGKVSVFTGQTGAGKSSLLNRLNPEWNLATGEISMALGRGKHTTRNVELYHFCDGKVLDTPGFSALNFHGVLKEKIKNAFKEFQNYSCPFRDCSHTKEKECDIKSKVLAGEIMESRYQSYLRFLEEGE